MENLGLSMPASVITSIPYNTASDGKSPVAVEYLLSTRGSAKSIEAGISEKRNWLTHDHLERVLGSKYCSVVAILIAPTTVDDEHDRLNDQLRRAKGIY